MAILSLLGAGAVVGKVETRDDAKKRKQILGSGRPKRERRSHPQQKEKNQA